jgi:hypothetical protein
MLRLAADENFRGDIVRGLLRRHPSFDIVRAQDVGLAGVSDPLILEWAAEENRILLTHDISTMPGLFEVGPNMSTADAINDILLIAECSMENEWENRIGYIPLRN